MEYEVRFYYNTNKLNELLSMLRSNEDLVENIRTYEKTIQYNHSDPKYDFYSKEIDGRFRLRISKNDKESKTKLSWKRRLNDNTSSLVNKEEEKEVNIDSEDFENFEYIVENVMHFTIVESYERYRTTFTNDDIEISLDEYPFGIALEIENKSTDKNPEEVVKDYVSKIGLDINDKYPLSCDDKYEELCKNQNIPIYREVVFDKEMPEVK